VIRQRYPEGDVELLQRAAWWDWPIEVISTHAGTLMADRLGGRPA
jgi:virginiamycin A acetyltransferase